MIVAIDFSFVSGYVDLHAVRDKAKAAGAWVEQGPHDPFLYVGSVERIAQNKSRHGDFVSKGLPTIITVLGKNISFEKGVIVGIWQDIESFKREMQQ